MDPVLFTSLHFTFTLTERVRLKAKEAKTCRPLLAKLGGTVGKTQTKAISCDGQQLLSNCVRRSPVIITMCWWKFGIGGCCVCMRDAFFSPLISHQGDLGESGGKGCIGRSLIPIF